MSRVAGLRTQLKKRLDANPIAAHSIRRHVDRDEMDPRRTIAKNYLNSYPWETAKPPTARPTFEQLPLQPRTPETDARLLEEMQRGELPIRLVVEVWPWTPKAKADERFDNQWNEKVGKREIAVRKRFSERPQRDGWFACERYYRGREYDQIAKDWRILTASWARFDWTKDSIASRQARENVKLRNPAIVGAFEEWVEWPKRPKRRPQHPGLESLTSQQVSLLARRWLRKI